MARPKIEIDAGEVERMAELGCTAGDIAHIIGCSRDTIDRRFADVLKKGFAKGNETLRKKQFDLATQGKGNVTMLIWLGKQRLGQTEKVVSVNEDHVQFRGSVIASPEWDDEQKEAYARYKRQAMGSN